MGKVLIITAHAEGPRVHLHTWRIHHGAVGLALSVLGLVLMIHDWKDRPWRLHD